MTIGSWQDDAGTDARVGGGRDILKLAGMNIEHIVDAPVYLKHLAR